MTDSLYNFSDFHRQVKLCRRGRLLSFGLSLRGDCQSCSAPLSLMSFEPNMHCHRCGARNPLPRAWWRKQLSKPDFMDALTAASETVFQKDLPGGFTLSFSSLPPQCPGCGGRFAAHGLFATSGGSCPSCGTIVAVRPVPTWAMGILDGLEAVACEQRSHGRLSVRRCSSCSRVLPNNGVTSGGRCNWCGQEHEGGAQWDFFFLMSFDADQLVDHWMADEERALSLLETDFEEEHAPALKIDPGLMAPLLHHPSVEVRTAMASWTRLPRSLGMELIHDRAPEVRKVVASWSEISLELAAELAWDEDSQVRQELLDNPSLPLGLLEALAMEGDLFLLRSVSRHPSLRRFSRDALQHLVEADDELILQNLLKTRQPPLALLELLAEHPDPRARRWVAGSYQFRNLSPELQRKLVKEAGEVQQAALDNQKVDFSVLSSLAGTKDMVVRLKLALQAQCLSLAQQQSLLEDASLDVVTTLAVHPSLHRELLETLHKDERKEVRLAVASNPKLPSHLASEMSMDYDDEVALQARNHSNFVKPGFWKMLQRSFLG